MLRRFLPPFGLLTGGVIGVGIFGLPASAARAGIVPFLLEMALVVGIVWIIQMLFAQVVLGTRERHRIPGYAEVYLGQGGKVVSLFSNVLGIVGALLAYLIAGGIFLQLLLEPLFPFLDLHTSVLLYFLVCALLLRRDVGKLASIEVVLLGVFLVVLVLLGFELNGYFHWNNIVVVGKESRILPYGVLLFSFWGMSMIPDVVEQSVRKTAFVKKILTASIIVAAATYLLFTIFTVGVTGTETSSEALSGLSGYLGGGAVTLGLIFGLLTTLSSFLALGHVLRETLTLDFSITPLFSWMLALFMPLLLFFSGIQELVSVLSITGAVFLGIEGIILLMIAQEYFRPKKNVPRYAHPRVLLGLGCLLVVGVVLAVVAEL